MKILINEFFCHSIGHTMYLAIVRMEADDGQAAECVDNETGLDVDITDHEVTHIAELVDDQVCMLLRA